MKIAVVQHALRPAPAQDLEALVIAVARAASLGAEFVVLPDVPAVYDGPLGDDLYRRSEEGAPGVVIWAAHRYAPDSGHGPLALAADPALVAYALVGDDAIDSTVLSACVTHKPGLLVLAPGAESELQAQAVLELAVALSTSLASVVVIAETDGAEAGEPGHGGSAIVHLGEVVAEAVAGDDLLLAEVATPLGPPEAPATFPELPPLLLQRIAAHQGRRVDVGYPADLG
ncbi:MAG: hypothetical protein WBJ62_05485 [Coriobacteriia bacterium]